MGVLLSAKTKDLLKAGIEIDAVMIPYQEEIYDEVYETRYEELLTAKICGKVVQSYTWKYLLIDCKFGGSNEWVADELDRLGVPYARD